MEGEGDHQDGNGDDERHVHECPRLALRDHDELVVPQVGVLLHGQLHDQLLVRHEVQVDGALAGCVIARGYRIRDVVHRLVQVELDPHVVRLDFVLAVKHEKVVAVLGDPAMKNSLIYNLRKRSEHIILLTEH